MLTDLRRTSLRPPAERLHWLPIVAVTFVGAVLGAIKLGSASVWLDEAVSANLASVPLREFLDLAGSKEANMSLYYLLLRPIRWINGSEWALRSLSVAAQTLSIPLLYRLGLRFDRGVAITAAGLLAINGFVVHYAHQARGYTLTLLLVVASTLLVVRATEKSSTGRWVAFGVVAGLGLYVHFFTFFVLVGQLTALTMVKQLRPNPRHWIAIAAPLATLIAPLAVFARSQRGGQIAWIPRTTFSTVVPTFKALVGLGGKALLVAYFVAAAAGAMAILFRRRRPLGILILFTASVPVVLAFAVSLAVPILRPQYLIVAIPGLSLLAALGIQSLGHIGARLAAAGLVAALAISALPNTYATLETHDWRGAAHFLAANGRPDDRLVFYAYYGWTPTWFYASTLKGVPPATFPSAPWTTPSIVTEQPLAPMVPLAIAGRRMWLVLNNARTDRPTDELALLLTSLKASGFKPGLYREFRGGIRVRVFERQEGTRKTSNRTGDPRVKWRG